MTFIRYIKLTLFLPYKIHTYFHKIRNRSSSAFVSRKETISIK